jgi:hypothetical protein
MMKMVIKRDKKENIESLVIEGASFYYAHMKSPVAVYDDRKLPYKDARKEYAIDIGVNEEIADAWDEVFAKQPSKKMTNAKFIETFKLDEENPVLPCPNEKKQYTIKSTQKAQYKDGEPVTEAMIPRAKMVVDGKAVDITFSTLIGNGSTGNVMIKVSKNDYGTFAYLYRVKVVNLVPYEAQDDGEKDFFGVDEIEQAVAPERGEVVTPKDAEKDEVPSKGTAVDTSKPVAEGDLDPDEF